MGAPDSSKSLGTLRFEDNDGGENRACRIKGEFSFFQSSLRLFQVTYFVKSRRTVDGRPIRAKEKKSRFRIE